MRNTPKFFITDVFGEEKYSGNQLATFINCSSFSDKEMQQIARETNFCETTFILSEELHNGGYDVRIFTPEKEIDFAGHPTLGTAYIIQQRIIRKPINKVVLNLKAGNIPVTFSVNDGTLWMEQIEPSFGKTLQAKVISKVLNLPESAIDSHFPIQEVSTGLPHIIVPLKKLDTLRSAEVSKEDYYKLIEKLDAKNILVFSPESYTDTHDISVRMFADYLGIPEDPATGSGNGCLAAYLVKHRYFLSAEINVRVGQGYEIGRPSLLLLSAKEAKGKLTVSVGGKVIPIAEGEWG